MRPEACGWFLWKNGRVIPNGRTLLALALVLPTGVPALAQTEEQVRQIAQARVSMAHAIASDAELLRAVLAKNAERETEEQLRTRDRQWTTNLADPLRRALTQSRCAERLRELVKDEPLVAEVILMDDHGANVCVSKATSDYWQGDEAKWEKTFREGLDPFVDAPAFDPSSGVFAVQLSVPVRKEGARVGALTLTLKILRAKASGR
jgi:hypothetical protein